MAEYGTGEKNVKKGYKPRKYKKTRSINGLKSGDGGIRTLVQTSNTQAFYMLSELLIFG